jgi:CO/xanthine dehydrogenase FAD-binding subunit
MIAHPFAYEAPADAEAAVALLAGDDGARVLGGGTWVVPEMTRGESAPSRIVDLRRAGLDAIEPLDGGGVRIGAMVTYAGLLNSAEVARRAPLLAIAAGGVTGGWAIRNQGTIGGAVIAARPQSDMPGALVASGAVAVVAGPAGRRRLPLHELLVGPMRAAVEPGELLVALELAPLGGRAAGYHKVKRGGSSWPIATGAALVALDAAGRCTDAALVLGAVAGTPLRVDLSETLVGQRVTPAVLAAASERAGALVREPWSDALAPGAYRQAIAAPVARRALQMACDQARDGG